MRIFNVSVAAVLCITSTLSLACSTCGGGLPCPQHVEINSSIEKLSNDAVMGDPMAASKLADYYQYEKYDGKKWRYWAIIAAENGDVKSQYAAFDILRASTDEVAQRRALYWLMKADKGGYLPAKLEMKRCFPAGTFEARRKECFGPKPDGEDPGP